MTIYKKIALLIDHVVLNVRDEKGGKVVQKHIAKNIGIKEPTLSKARSESLKTIQMSSLKAEGIYRKICQYYRLEIDSNGAPIAYDNQSSTSFPLLDENRIYFLYYFNDDAMKFKVALLSIDEETKEVKLTFYTRNGEVRNVYEGSYRINHANVYMHLKYRNFESFIILRIESESNIGDFSYLKGVYANAGSHSFEPVAGDIILERINKKDLFMDCLTQNKPKDAIFSETSFRRLRVTDGFFESKEDLLQFQNELIPFSIVGVYNAFYLKLKEEELRSFVIWVKPNGEVDVKTSSYIIKAQGRIIEGGKMFLIMCDYL